MITLDTTPTANANSVGAGDGNNDSNDSKDSNGFKDNNGDGNQTNKPPYENADGITIVEEVSGFQGGQVVADEKQGCVVG
jgi:hypothetical protein